MSFLGNGAALGSYNPPMAYFVILLIVVVLGRWAWLIAGLIAYGAGYHFMGPALAVVFALTLIVPPTPRGARNRR